MAAPKIAFITADSAEAKEAETALVARYGAATVAMTIDEEGMAHTAERKLAIAVALTVLESTTIGVPPAVYGIVMFPVAALFGLPLAAFLFLHHVRRTPTSFPWPAKLAVGRASAVADGTVWLTLIGSALSPGAPRATARRGRSRACSRTASAWLGETCGASRPMIRIHQVEACSRSSMSGANLRWWARGTVTS